MNRSFGRSPVPRLLGATLAWCLTTPAHAQAPLYTLTDLGNLHAFSYSMTTHQMTNLGGSGRGQ
jgi:hypothetical protein